MDRHTSEDYIKFLKKVDKSCCAEKTLHIIVDNYSMHKTKEVKAYMETVNGRFVVHYTPTHASWLNLVERWFAQITNKRIGLSSLDSVQQLIKAIKDYIKAWNKTGKAFKWTKSVDDILSSITKAKSSIPTTD